VVPLTSQGQDLTSPLPTATSVATEQPHVAGLCTVMGASSTSTGVPARETGRHNVPMPGSEIVADIYKYVG
jgi:hypothetical protein